MASGVSQQRRGRLADCGASFWGARHGRVRGGPCTWALKFDRYCRVTKPGFSFGATTDRAGKPINSAWKELSSKLLVF